MEQALLERLKTTTVRSFSPFNAEHSHLMSEIVDQIFSGNLETALEIITTNGSGDKVVQPLRHSILKRILLRLIWPSNPEMYLQGVELDAPQLSTVTENLSEETLEQLYIEVFTQSYNIFEKVLNMYTLLRLYAQIMRFRKIHEKFEKINIFTDPSRMQLVLLACCIFAIMMFLLSFF